MSGVQNHTQKSEVQSCEETLYKLKLLCVEINRVLGGEEYLERVARFLDDQCTYFMHYWRFIGTIETHITVAIPIWRNGQTDYLHLSIANIGKNRKFSIKDIQMMVKNNYCEIIRILLDGLQEFFEYILKYKEDK